MALSLSSVAATPGMSSNQAGGASKTSTRKHFSHFGMHVAQYDGMSSSHSAHSTHTSAALATLSLASQIAVIKPRVVQGYRA